MNFTSPIDSTFVPLRFDKFGDTEYPARKGKPHSGVDLRPHQNGGSRSVYAIADGVITISTNTAGAYYQIDHGNGWSARYVHMFDRPLSVGTKVKQGQKIGSYSTSDNHLHFSLLENNQLIDPQTKINFSDSKILPQNIQNNNQDMQFREKIINILESFFTANKDKGFPNDDGNRFGYLRGLIYAENKPEKALELILNDYKNTVKKLQEVSINVNKELDTFKQEYLDKEQEYIKEIENLTADKFKLTTQNQEYLEIIQEQAREIEELKKSNNQKPSQNQGLPYWLRALYDSARNFTGVATIFLLGSGAWQIIQEFLLKQEFNFESLIYLFGSVVTALLTYYQETAKAERKKDEKKEKEKKEKEKKEKEKNENETT